MNFEKFVNKIKISKSSEIRTGDTVDLAVVRLSPTKFYLYIKSICPCCKKYDKENGINVEFNHDPKLTIFEAELLYMLFAQNKVPYDYSNYHESEAGKRFIENFISWKS
jgi:hypothetical protein